MKVQVIKNAQQGSTGTPGKFRVDFYSHSSECLPTAPSAHHSINMSYTSDKSPWDVAVKMVTAWLKDYGEVLTSAIELRIQQEAKAGEQAHPGEVQITCTEDEAVVLAGHLGRSSGARDRGFQAASPDIAWGRLGQEIYDTLAGEGLGYTHPKYPRHAVPMK